MCADLSCSPPCQLVNAVILSVRCLLLLLCLSVSCSLLLPCLSGGQCCYYQCQMLIDVTLPQCQLLVAVALPVSWSMLLLSVSNAHWCYSASVSVASCCCLACQVVNAVILRVSWSLLLLTLSGDLCRWTMLLLFLSVVSSFTLPVRWPMLLLSPSAGVNCCIACLLVHPVALPVRLFLFAGLTATVPVACLNLCCPISVKRSSLSMVCSPCHVFILGCSFLPCGLCNRSLCQHFRRWYMLLLVSVWYI